MQNPLWALLLPHFFHDELVALGAVAWASLNRFIMYDYLVVLQFPGLPFPECLKSFDVVASNRYCARKLAMHKYCKHAIWWAAVLKDWGP